MAVCVEGHRAGPGCACRCIFQEDQGIIIMASQYFLGIDTSTTSSKALLIDEKGAVIAVESSAHTLQTPKPLWSEQDPQEWWQAVSASIKSVLKKAGISGESV